MPLIRICIPACCRNKYRPGPARNRLLEQFALPCAREERVSLEKMLFTTRQILQTHSKDVLAKREDSL
ncbi:hypothetical protein Mal48_28820 [Thalassoglobus polymorphus]|uniref:Uncharacterized protein n=1 Tax=Thalassoglobus polymorphus TaxID=2527994 RepID=A0A517QPQ9_9PLAN|nr:hypothetical protein Mal48_28820 [Thalassoglobus polymorphus]